MKVTQSRGVGIIFTKRVKKTNFLVCERHIVKGHKYLCTQEPRNIGVKAT